MITLNDVFMYNRKETFSGRNGDNSEVNNAFKINNNNYQLKKPKNLFNRTQLNAHNSTNSIPIFSNKFENKEWSIHNNSNFSYNKDCKNPRNNLQTFTSHINGNFNTDNLCKTKKKRKKLNYENHNNFKRFKYNSSICETKQNYSSVTSELGVHEENRKDEDLFYYDISGNKNNKPVEFPVCEDFTQNKETNLHLERIKKCNNFDTNKILHKENKCNKSTVVISNDSCVSCKKHRKRKKNGKNKIKNKSFPRENIGHCNVLASSTFKEKKIEDIKGNCSKVEKIKRNNSFKDVKDIRDLEIDPRFSLNQVQASSTEDFNKSHLNLLSKYKNYGKSFGKKNKEFLNTSITKKKGNKDIDTAINISESECETVDFIGTSSKKIEKFKSIHIDSGAYNTPKKRKKKRVVEHDTGKGEKINTENSATVEINKYFGKKFNYPYEKILNKHQIQLKQKTITEIESDCVMHKDTVHVINKNCNNINSAFIDLDSDSYIIAKKKKKKSVEDNILEDSNIEKSVLVEINRDFEQRGNKSNGQILNKLKKKKKKRKNRAQSDIENDKSNIENNSYEEIPIEKHTFLKKKKKSKNRKFNNSVSKQEINKNINQEGSNIKSERIDFDTGIIPKKKKKKKAVENNIPEEDKTNIENSSEYIDIDPGIIPKKKKKKKAVKNNIPEEDKTNIENTSEFIDIDTGIIPKKRKKKKAVQHNILEEDKTNIENLLSEHIDIDTGIIPKKKKKRKGIESNIPEENKTNIESSLSGYIDIDTGIILKKKKKRKAIESNIPEENKTNIESSLSEYIDNDTGIILKKKKKRKAIESNIPEENKTNIESSLSEYIDNDTGIIPKKKKKRKAIESNIPEENKTNIESSLSEYIDIDTGIIPKKKKKRKAIESNIPEENKTNIESSLSEYIDIDTGIIPKKKKKRKAAENNIPEKDKTNIENALSEPIDLDNYIPKREKKKTVENNILEEDKSNVEDSVLVEIDITQNCCESDFCVFPKKKALEFDGIKTNIENSEPLEIVKDVGQTGTNSDSKVLTDVLPREKKKKDKIQSESDILNCKIKKERVVNVTNEESDNIKTFQKKSRKERSKLNTDEKICDTKDIAHMPTNIFDDNHFSYNSKISPKSRNDNVSDQLKSKYDADLNTLINILEGKFKSESPTSTNSNEKRDDIDIEYNNIPYIKTESNNDIEDTVQEMLIEINKYNKKIVSCEAENNTSNHASNLKVVNDKKSKILDSKSLENTHLDDVEKYIINEDQFSDNSEIISPDSRPIKFKKTTEIENVTAVSETLEDNSKDTLKDKEDKFEYINKFKLELKDEKVSPKEKETEAPYKLRKRRHTFTNSDINYLKEQEWQNTNEGNNKTKLHRYRRRSTSDVYVKKNETGKKERRQVSIFTEFMQSLECPKSENDDEKKSFCVEELTADSLEIEIEKLRNLSVIFHFTPPLLHSIATRTTTPTTEQREMFKKLNLSIKTGAFNKQEDEKIIENWKKLCDEHDLLINPTLFIKFPRRMNPDIKVNILRYIAHGLENRLLHRVYSRLRYLLQKHKFKTGRFTPEEDEAILDFMDETTSSKPFMDLSALLNRIPLSVEKRYDLITKNDNKVNHWTADMADRLVKTMMKTTKCQKLSTLRHRDLTSKEWRKVSKKMDRIAVSKLQRAWRVTIYPRLFSKEVDLRGIKEELINILYDRNETDWKTVNWKEIATNFKGFTAAKLYAMFKHLVHFHITKEKRSDLKECLDFFKNKLIKYHKISTTHKFKKFVVKDGNIVYEDA